MPNEFTNIIAKTKEFRSNKLTDKKTNAKRVDLTSQLTKRSGQTVQVEQIN